MATKKGTSSGDTQFGTNKADTISGRGGNDTIWGGDGNDKIFGGSGNDWIDAGNGNDKVFGGSGNDWIDGGNGDDKIHGGKGDDSIYGGAGNDRIKGGSGDDLIAGGAGADKLTGNSGNDHFIYLANSDSPAGWGWDRITDFTQGQDKIDLAALLESTDLAWGNTTATANGAWYQNSGSSTFVFADTDGDSTADLKIELKHTPGLNLTVDDFIGVSEAPQENSAPVAFADNVITGVSPGDPLFIPKWALLANDIDPDGDPLDIESVVTETVDATVSLTFLDGFVTLFDSDQDETNPLSFDYVATDGQALSVVPATVNVTQDLDGTIDGTSGNDILVGATNEGATFIGNGGNDILVGGGRNDTLDGGSGNDILSGGLGDDIFDYNAVSDSGVGPGNRDVIRDFQGANALFGDLIDLLTIDSGDGDQTFGFAGNTTSVVANSVTWHQTGGNTIIQGDTNGDTAQAEFQIELMGLHTLAAGDFIL